MDNGTVNVSIIMLINNKHQSIKLFSDGCFGNRLRYWDTIEELKKNPPLENIVVMRYRGDWGGGFCKYDVPLSQPPSAQGMTACD